MQNDVTINLASGESLRVTQLGIDLLGVHGVRNRTFLMPTIARVSRVNNAMTLHLVSGSDATFQMASPDDADLLGAALQSLHSSPPEVIAKTYDKELHYIRDVSDLATSGWRVVSTTVFQPRSGWARILFSLGWLAVVYPPKPQIIVTYQRR